MSRSSGIFISTIVILALFGGVLTAIQTQSFWLDEGWTAWAVHDVMRDPETLRETARYIRSSLMSTLEKTRSDVHPPLYFLSLDLWVMAAGQSEFALRLPSTLSAMLALAGIYAIGTIWFNRKTGIIALILLGTSGFFLYYGRDARMYPLFLAFTILATWAYSRWWQHPDLKHGMFYGMLITLALYTHYVSIAVIFTHGVHLLLSRRLRPATLLPYLLALILFAPWLRVAYSQITTHPGGAAANFLPSDRNTLAAVWLLLTSGYWLNFTLPFIFGCALLDAFRMRTAIGLLVLLVVLPPAALWILNARGFAILQMRYLIVIVPAWSLLVAYAIERIDLSIIGFRSDFARSGLQLFFVIWLAYTQISMFDNLWPEKPRWREAVMGAALARTADEPALVSIDPRSPAAYYDQVAQLSEGISINIGWRRFNPHEIDETAAYLDHAERVWAILSMANPTSWDAVAALTTQRGTGYRDSVQGTIFYRFDSGTRDRLQFQFGDGAPFAWDFQTFTLAAGEELCPPLPPVPEGTQIELALIRGYDEVSAAVVGAPCVTIPPSDEPLYVRVAVLDASGSRMPLIENDLYWGDFLFQGVIE